MREMQMADDGGRGGQMGAVVVGLVCGAAIGAALGLLFAPKPGAELRDQIGDSADRLKRRASKTYEDAVGAFGAVVDQSRRAVERGREAFNAARQQAAPAIDSEFFDGPTS